MGLLIVHTVKELFFIGDQYLLILTTNLYSMNKTNRYYRTVGNRAIEMSVKLYQIRPVKKMFCYLLEL